MILLKCAFPGFYCKKRSKSASAKLSLAWRGNHAMPRNATPSMIRKLLIRLWHSHFCPCFCVSLHNVTTHYLFGIAGVTISFLWLSSLVHFRRNSYNFSLSVAFPVNFLALSIVHCFLPRLTILSYTFM